MLQSPVNSGFYFPCTALQGLPKNNRTRYDRIKTLTKGEVMNAYPGNLKNELMVILETLIPVPSTGRALKWKMTDIVNAIFYVVRTGCPWRYLPSDFPPWQTVYYRIVIELISIFM